MSKKKLRYLDWCYIPILRGLFLVVCTDDYKWLDKKFNATDLLNDGTAGMAFNGEYKGYDAYVLVLNLWRAMPINNGVITHEVGHITNLLFANRGWVKLKCDEPQCYVQEWFANKTYQMLKKQKLHKLIVNDNPNQ